MSSFGYSRQLTVLDGSSANSSLRTSNAFLVADAQQISFSASTAAAVSGQTITVQGSNDDGLTVNAGALTFSTVSSVAAPGIFSITPGMRWVRFVRNAVDSQTSITMNYRAW